MVDENVPNLIYLHEYVPNTDDRDNVGKGSIVDEHHLFDRTHLHYVISSPFSNSKPPSGLVNLLSVDYNEIEYLSFNDIAKKHNNALDCNEYPGEKSIFSIYLRFENGMASPRERIYTMLDFVDLLYLEINTIGELYKFFKRDDLMSVTLKSERDVGDFIERMGNLYTCYLHDFYSMKNLGLEVIRSNK